MCLAYINGMEHVKNEINDFSEQDLKGQAYESAKRYFSRTYIPLADGIILLSEEIMNAHKQFPESYKLEVDRNSLQSDLLENKIQLMEYQIQSLEMIQMEYPIINLSIAGMLRGLRFMQSKTKEKLQRLITFDQTSSKIFSEIESILSEVQIGLSEINNARAWNPATGKFDTSKLNLT